MIPLLLRIKCGGVNPDGEMRCQEDILLAVGTRKREGLTLSVIDSALSEAGWVLTRDEVTPEELGVGEEDAGGAETFTFVDPLCPECGQAFFTELFGEDGPTLDSPEEGLSDSL